ncbi:MAG TPA: hypothetical protein VJY41_11325 [Prolixibacteraceae bacterium]|nr:hypothetical protein [Prolixibacteraceae bacterium]
MKERRTPFNDPFSLFAAVIKNEISLEHFDLSSLENNLVVMKILDAAIKSAKTEKTIEIKK